MLQKVAPWIECTEIMLNVSKLIWIEQGGSRLQSKFYNILIVSDLSVTLVVGMQIVTKFRSQLVRFEKLLTAYVTQVTPPLSLTHWPVFCSFGGQRICVIWVEVNSYFWVIQIDSVVSR